MKAILAFSGGLDSTCLLLHLLSKNYEVKCISFDYGQRHELELERAKKNIVLLQEKGFNLQHQILDVKGIFSDSVSSLLPGSGVEVPEGHYESEVMKVTVVENRNIIFSSIIYGKALAWANKTNSDVEIFLGIHSGDHSIYPDCREESRLAAELCFKISNWNSEKVSYKAPFVKLSKSQVLSQGIEAIRRINQLDLSYNRPQTFGGEKYIDLFRNTNTCYSPNEEGESCGKCGSCQERLEAFAENNLIDPVPYQL